MGVLGVPTNLLTHSSSDGLPGTDLIMNDNAAKLSLFLREPNEIAEELGLPDHLHTYKGTIRAQVESRLCPYCAEAIPCTATYCTVCSSGKPNRMGWLFVFLHHEYRLSCLATGTDILRLCARDGCDFQRSFLFEWVQKMILIYGEEPSSVLALPGPPPEVSVPTSLPIIHIETPIDPRVVRHREREARLQGRSSDHQIDMPYGAGSEGKPRSLRRAPLAFTPVLLPRVAP